MPLKTSRLDLAGLLESDEDIRVFLEESARECTPEEFAHALGIANRARARLAGFPRTVPGGVNKGGSPLT